jgi:hypothetical protein
VVQQPQLVIAKQQLRTKAQGPVESGAQLL